MIDFVAMAPLACLMHWYISMMYVVPVLAVGGWGWYSSKRMARRKAEGRGGQGGPTGGAGAAGGGSRTATVA